MFPVCLQSLIEYIITEQECQLIKQKGLQLRQKCWVTQRLIMLTKYVICNTIKEDYITNWIIKARIEKICSIVRAMKKGKGRL